MKGHKKSLYDWRKQCGSDKRLYKQAKEIKSSRVGYYGRLYRESLAGYRRAKKRRSNSYGLPGVWGSFR